MAPSPKSPEALAAGADPDPWRRPCIGSAFRSKRFATACRRLGLQHSFTRPYRPRTNGKAERFIQSALREWAYGIPYQHSTERTAMLKRWNHHYNWHRPHQGIGGIAPMSRLSHSRNNLLTLHI